MISFPLFYFSEVIERNVARQLLCPVTDQMMSGMQIKYKIFLFKPTKHLTKLCDSKKEKLEMEALGHYS